MICYLCGYIQDYDPSGLCIHCKDKVQRNNERVRLLSLIRDAERFCPVWLRQRMELAR